MREKKSIINKVREWIQNNFFGLIIFLVLILIILLVASLFIPINVSHFPDNSIQLEKYNAGVEQRTIIIRSLSSIISGISVVIAFVSLLQSRNSEVKKERLQVMPFPAYAVPIEDVQYSSTAVSKLKIKQEHPYPDNIVQSTFDITIKNIGLGSLVDYEILEAYYKDAHGKIMDLTISYNRSFILGKQETIRMAIDVTAGFISKQTGTHTSLDTLTIVASFNDLLGHKYIQEFTVFSDVRSIAHQNLTLPDGKNKTGIIYALNPKKINHTHPRES